MEQNTRKIIRQTEDFILYDESDDYMNRDVYEYFKPQTRIIGKDRKIVFDKLVIEECNSVFGGDFFTYAFYFLNDELIATD